VSSPNQGVLKGTQQIQIEKRRGTQEMGKGYYIRSVAECDGGCCKLTTLSITFRGYQYVFFQVALSCDERGGKRKNDETRDEKDLFHGSKEKSLSDFCLPRPNQSTVTVMQGSGIHDLVLLFLPFSDSPPPICFALL
jgi:hypothetical protein